MATVKLTNNVLISEESLEVAVDINNLLFTLTSPTGGTSSAKEVTSDCYCIFTGNGGIINSADNLVVFSARSGTQSQGYLGCFVKKGTKVQAQSNYWNGTADVKGYGLK